jgi:hypothetical protein
MFKEYAAGQKSKSISSWMWHHVFWWSLQTFRRNADRLVPYYTGLHPSTRCENLKSIGSKTVSGKYIATDNKKYAACTFLHHNGLHVHTKCEICNTLITNLIRNLALKRAPFLHLQLQCLILRLYVTAGAAETRATPISGSDRSTTSRLVIQ